jgi:cytidyltransferase-like protein
MKKVMVFGTFDLFHPGHQDFLWQAWSLGDHLTVIVARDVNAQPLKKTRLIENEVKRLQNIQEWLWKNNIFGEVWLGNPDFTKRYLILKKVIPTLICFGYDQKIDWAGLQTALKKYKLNEVGLYRLRAYHPEIYKSTKLRQLKK